MSVLGSSSVVDVRHVKNLVTGSWDHRVSASPRRPSPPKTASSTSGASPRRARGPVFGSSPQRDPRLHWSTQYAPHVYSHPAFPTDDRHSPRVRVRALSSPRKQSATNLKPSSVAVGGGDEIVAVEPDVFEAKIEMRGEGMPPPPLPPLAAVQQARQKLKTANTASALALASIKVSSYASKSQRGLKSHSMHDAPPLVCLLNGASPVVVMQRYREFCETTLGSVAKRGGSPSHSGRATSFAENQEEAAELASSRNAMELHPSTFNGPFVDLHVQHSLLQALVGGAMPLDFGADTVKDVVASTVATNTAAALGAFLGADDRAGIAGRSVAPQYHTSLPSYRFCHYFAVVSDHLSAPMAVRNFAFLLSCFDPTGCGKVPQHLLLDGGFLVKFVTRHVWEGVKDAWMKLCDVIQKLNDLRRKEADALLAYVRGEPVALSHFTWAIETFVGSHDWHRDRDGRGKPISKALFGVPWNETRCVFLGVAEIAAVLEEADLCFDRQQTGPLV